jgi:hypothetical protein
MVVNQKKDRGLSSFKLRPTLRSRYGIQLPHFEPMHVTTFAKLAV